jgi:hypothetical protein
MVETLFTMLPRYLILIAVLCGGTAAQAATVASIADCLPLLTPPAARELVAHLGSPLLADHQGDVFHPFPDTEIHRFRIIGVYRTASTTVALDLPAWMMDKQLHLGFDGQSVEKGLAILEKHLPQGWLRPAGFSTIRTTFRGFGVPQMLDVELDMILSRWRVRFKTTVRYRMDLARGTLTETTAGPAELLRMAVAGETDAHFQHFLGKHKPGQPVAVSARPEGLRANLTYDVPVGNGASLVLGGIFELRRRSLLLEWDHYSLDIRDLDRVTFSELVEIRTSPEVRWLMRRANSGGHLLVESHPSGKVVKAFCGCGHWIHYLVGQRITVLASNLPRVLRD